MAEIAPEVDPWAVDATAPIREAFDIDSVDFLSLLARLEQSAGVSIPEADYPRVGTLQGLLVYLQAH
jgi:acyl carrier protein